MDVPYCNALLSGSSYLSETDEFGKIWKEQVHSSLANLLVECCNQLHLGNWELFRSLATTIISHDATREKKKLILDFLKKIYENPHLFCNGSSRVDNPYEIYWLCAQFHAEMSENEEEKDLLLADAGFRHLLGNICGDKAPNEQAADLYKLLMGLLNDQHLVSQSGFPLEGKVQLANLVKKKSALGVAVFEQLLQFSKLKPTNYFSKLLWWLHDITEQWLSVIEFFNSSTFHSVTPDSVVDEETTYRLLSLFDYFEGFNVPMTNGECPQAVQHSESDVTCTKIDKLLNRIWQLCERGILDKGNVYYALLSHRDPWMIQRLLHLEDQIKIRINHENTNISSENFLRLINNSDNELNFKELFLHSVINGTHFLESIVNSCFELIHAGQRFLPSGILQNPPLCQLKPLVLLLAWTKVKTVAEIVNFVEAYQLFYSASLPTDPDLNMVCHRLASKAKLVLALLKCHSWKRSTLKDRDIAILLSQLQEHSALYILHYCSNINLIERPELFDILKNWLSVLETDAISRSCDHHNLEQLRDEMLMHGFNVLFDFFQIVHESIKVDQLIEERRLHHKPFVKERHTVNQSTDQNLEDVYSLNVALPLSKIVGDVSQIYPLTFRVEILENAFSLLFLTRQHLRDDDQNQSCSSGSEEEHGEISEHNVNSESYETDLASKNITCRASASSPEKSILKQKTLRSKSAVKRNQQSSESANSSSVTSKKSRFGFLLNKFVVCDLLNCLKQCVVEASTASKGETLVRSTDSRPNDLAQCVSSSINEKSLAPRLSTLFRYITEAQWRYQLVVGDVAVGEEERSLGHRFVDEDCLASDWTYEFYRSSFSEEEDNAEVEAHKPPKIISDSKKKAPQRKMPPSRKGSDCRFLRKYCSPNIISKMFSSSESLLNSCLLQNSLSKAEQVIKMFGMEHTSMADEVEFALHYGKVVQDLTECMSGHLTQSRLPVANSSQSTKVAWKSIVQAAQFGMGGASTETLLTDELLASHKVPEVVEVARLDSKSCLSSWLSDPMDWRACVRTDLALVACCDISASQSLLETTYLAFRSSSGSSSRVMKKSSTAKGMLGIVNDLLGVISFDVNVQAGEQAAMGSYVGRLRGISEMLRQSLLPLSEKAYKSNKTSWERVEKVIYELHQRLKAEQNSLNREESGPASLPSTPITTAALPEKISLSSRHPFHVLFKKLMKYVPPLRSYLDEDSYHHLSEKVPLGGPAEERRAPVYLSTMFEYSKNLAVAVAGSHTDSSSSNRMGCFSVCLQSPIATVINILKSNSLSPTELERFTQHMNLNLMDIIIRYYCPNIPVARNEAAILKTLSKEECKIQTATEESTSFEKDSPSQNILCPINAELLAHLEEKCWLAVLLMRLLTNDLSVSDDGSTDAGIILYPVLYRYLEQQTSNNFSSKSILQAFSPFISFDHINLKIENLIEKQNWKKCLQYINSQECQVSPSLRRTMESFRNLVLSKLSLNMEYNDETCSPWLYLMQMRDDSNYKANLVLEHYHKWPAEGAIMALQDSAASVSVNDSVWKELTMCLEKVQFYEKIVKALSSGRLKLEVYTNVESITWQEVLNIANEDISSLIGGLWKAKEYKLIMTLSKLHCIPEHMKEIIDDSDVLSALDGSTVSAAALLKSLEKSSTPEQRLIICRHALRHIRKVKTNFSIIIRVLDTADLQGAKETKLLNFLRQKIAMKILMCLPPEEQHDYKDIIKHPHVMIEQMLMNIKIEALQNAFRDIREDLNFFTQDEFLSFEYLNCILETYASKAIDVRVIHIAVNEPLNVVLPINSSEKPPVFEVPLQVPSKQQWTPDASVTKCMVCSVERFSMFNRRHHCRRCGRVVCGICSQKKKKVTGYGDIVVRVCDDCYGMDPVSPFPETTESLEDRLKIHFGNSGSFESASCGVKSDDQSYNPVKESTTHITLRLSTNASHNKTAREEFSFEQAPSVTLCLSICDLLWDQHKSGHYLLSLADSLFKLLQPVSPGFANPEIDFSLVISMLICVLLSAKVKFSKTFDHQYVTKCDLYLGLVDILTLLVNANCKHLIPVGDLAQSDAVRKLRDLLMKEERWKLALDISTKGGLDVTGVWSTWGMACLKMGQYSFARKKFSYCMQRLKSQNKTAQCQSLLKEIVDTLMNAATKGENESTCTSFLAKLAEIKNSGCVQREEILERPCGDIHLKIRDECLYYIQTFGNHTTNLSFYSRCGEWENALKYVFETRCPTAHFIEDVVMLSLRKGCFSKVTSAMLQLDNTLEKWGDYFEALCRYFEHNELYHTLYDLQLFLKDYARCALTCIHFYKAGAKSYGDLNVRVPHLLTAKQHLKNVRQSSGVGKLGTFNKFIMRLPHKEVERYLRGIDLQIEVTTFLCDHPNRMPLDLEQSLVIRSGSDRVSLHQSTSSNLDVKVSIAGPLPTLFDDPSSRAHLIAMVIINGNDIFDGFPLCESIMKEFGLHKINTYSLITRLLIVQQRLSDALTFVVQLKANGSCNTEECDRIVLKTVTVALKGGFQFQSKDIGMIIRSISEDKNKINAYIQFGKLKAAYLLAVKRERAEDVNQVLNEAIRTGQTTIKTICEKWLDLKKT